MEILFPKKGLLDTANSMGLNTSDLNAQLAFIRVESNTTCKSGWDALKTAKTVNEASDYVLQKIEITSDSYIDQRRQYSNTIYNVMSKINYFI